MAVSVAHPFLPDMHIAVVGTVVPLHTYLLGICTPGHSEARAI